MRKQDDVMMNYDKKSWNMMKYDDDELRTKYTIYLVVKVKKKLFLLEALEMFFFL